MLHQKFGSRDPQYHQEENNDRYFEDHGDAQHYVDEQIEVTVDRECRCDARKLADAQQERESIAKGQEVGEESTENEQAARGQHEGDGPFALSFIEAGGDEGPYLIEDPRRPEEQRRDKRSPHPDDFELL